MKLYAAVAVLTFVGSFAVYSATQMSGVAHSIGGNSNGQTSYSDILYNPFLLLQPGRLRALVSSSDGLPRTDTFRSRFDGDQFKVLQPPKINIDTRRVWSGTMHHQYRPPVVHSAPSYRHYR